MVCSQSLKKGLRTVVGVSLCLLVVSASPMSRSVLGEEDPSSDLYSSPQAIGLVHFLRSAVANSVMRESSNPELNLSAFENMRASKRGFGIAGLDNVDMITSTLDRSRSRSRSRSRQGQRMSSGLTLNQLRDLMKIAG
ncbi:uncharacterized protein [Littorina saxatilis]|uniref:Uncharacterized protein n=1 Tax=Littorina saxatilis TaxID=31220 RepID=A0AAN9B5B3_9CAEN